MSLQSILSTIAKIHQEYKAIQKEEQEKKAKIDQKRLEEERIKLEEERRKLEEAQKIVVRNAHLVSHQTVKIIKRIFEIYPTNNVDNVEFSTEEYPGGAPEHKILFYKPQDKTVIINLYLLFVYSWQLSFINPDDGARWMRSIRNSIYRTLIDYLLSLLYDIENSALPSNDESEKKELLEQYAKKFELQLIPGFEKASTEDKLIFFSNGKWVCSNCRSYYEFNLSRDDPVSLTENYFLKNMNDEAYISKNHPLLNYNTLLCSKCYVSIKNLDLEDMVKDELCKRESEREKPKREKREEILRGTKLRLFSGSPDYEPPLVIKEPYIAPMIFKELMKGVDSEQIWASYKLNWPDTSVFFEFKYFLGNTCFYSMHDAYKYWLSDPHIRKKPTEDESRKKKVFWEKILYDDEYYQLIPKYEQELKKLKSYVPPRKGWFDNSPQDQRLKQSIEEIFNGFSKK